MNAGGARGFTVEQIGRLLDISSEHVRSLVKAAFPKAPPPALQFQDLVVLRAAKGLVDASIPPRKIRTALERLRKQLPEGAPLSAVTLHAERDRIVVDDGRIRWNPESGQSLFDFEVKELEDRVERLSHEACEAAAAHPSGTEAYERGYFLEEEGDWAGAIAAYREAISLDASLADAWLNLGRLLHERGALADGESHYRRALEVRPGDATTLYNLGTVLEDLRREPEAIVAYEQALAHDPAFRDAHYNLARLYERAGRATDAVRHLKQYRTLAHG